MLRKSEWNLPPAASRTWASSRDGSFVGVRTVAVVPLPHWPASLWPNVYLQAAQTNQKQAWSRRAGRPAVVCIKRKRKYTQLHGQQRPRLVPHARLHT